MRRLILALIIALSPTWSSAQALEEQIVAALQAQGFAVEAMNRTWLGRLRVVAQSDTYYRELVFDPATGAVLQDYVTTLSARESSLAEQAAASEDRYDDDGNGNGAAARAAENWSDVVQEPALDAAVMVPTVSAQDIGN
jgi:hypothetical protein